MPVIVSKPVGVILRRLADVLSRFQSFLLPETPVISATT